MDKFYKLCMFVYLDSIRDHICHTFIRHDISEIKSIYQYFLTIFPNAKFSLSFITEKHVEFGSIDINEGIFEVDEK